MVVKIGINKVPSERSELQAEPKDCSSKTRQNTKEIRQNKKHTAPAHVLKPHDHAALSVLCTSPCIPLQRGTEQYKKPCQGSKILTGLCMLIYLLHATYLPAENLIPFNTYCSAYPTEPQQYAHPLCVSPFPCISVYMQRFPGIHP